MRSSYMDFSELMIITEHLLPDSELFFSFVGSRALSFKRPLLSVDVDVCLSVCLSVSMSATLRSNISETKGDRG